MVPALIAAPVPRMGGKERRPSCVASRRSRVEHRQLNRLRRCSGWAAAARVRSARQMTRGSRGQPHFRGRPPGRPLLFVIRRRQPGERDEGTGATARRTRRVRARVPSRRLRTGFLPSRGCSPGPPATAGTGPDTWEPRSLSISSRNVRRPARRPVSASRFRSGNSHSNVSTLAGSRRPARCSRAAWR